MDKTHFDYIFFGLKENLIESVFTCVTLVIFYNNTKLIIAFNAALVCYLDSYENVKLGFASKKKVEFTA